MTEKASMLQNEVNSDRTRSVKYNVNSSATIL